MGIEADGKVLREKLDEAKARLKQLRGRSAATRSERAELAALVDELEHALADMVFEAREKHRIESTARVLKHQAMQTGEQRRVRDILARDRADAAAERFRREAEIEFEAGKPVMMADAVVPPTREQLASGEFDRYTPRQPDGSTREVTTHRRRSLPQVQRLVLSGVIDADGFRDCLWYSKLFDESGLAGNVGSIDYGREVFASPLERVAFSDRQIEAQDTLRFIRNQIAARRCYLLDQVVIADVAFTLAYRRSGLRTREHRRMGVDEGHRLFAEIVEELGAARNAAN